MIRRGSCVKGVFAACFVLAATSPPALGQSHDSLRARLAARIAATPAEAVGVYFRDLGSGDSVLLDADHRFHAASTMKLPVMIQLFRDRDAGLLSLDDSLAVTNTFRSILDSSPYHLDPADDSDSSLYKLVGQQVTIRRLIELMETVSSNLATNLLINRVGAPPGQRDRACARRGLHPGAAEDIPAYRAGRNNTTTARDLGTLLVALAQDRAASAASCREMRDILSRQHFTEGIPAGLPAGTRVEHKTGWIEGVVYHDAAIVLPAGRAPYVLVVLTGGIQQDSVAYDLVADVSRIVYRAVERQ